MYSFLPDSDVFPKDTATGRLIEAVRHRYLSPRARAAADFAKELDLRAQTFDRLNGNEPRVDNIRMEIKEFSGWQRFRLMIGGEHVGDLHPVGKDFDQSPRAEIVGMQIGARHMKAAPSGMDQITAPDGVQFMSGPGIYGRHPIDIDRALARLDSLKPQAGLRLNETPAQVALGYFADQMNDADGGQRFTVRTTNEIGQDGELRQTHELMVDGEPYGPISTDGTDVLLGDDQAPFALDDASSALDSVNAQIDGPSLPTPSMR